MEPRQLSSNPAALSVGIMMLTFGNSTLRLELIAMGVNCFDQGQLWQGECRSSATSRGNCLLHRQRDQERRGLGQIGVEINGDDWLIRPRILPGELERAGASFSRLWVGSILPSQLGVGKVHGATAVICEILAIDQGNFFAFSVCE